MAGRTGALSKEQEKLGEYIEMFEAGRLNAQKVIQEFASRSLFRRLVSPKNDLIRYDAALRCSARGGYRETREESRASV